jgi:hypothetical protein
VTGAGDRNTATIRRLIGVYNANGTLGGELAYFIGSRLGRTHCALCDITHGRVRPRPEWNACRAGLPVPFETYHANDQPSYVRAAYDGTAPVILAETDDGVVPLLDAEELDACAGSVEKLMHSIEHAADRLALRVPDLQLD